MASTYTLEHVEGQGVSFGDYGSRAQPRVDPHKRKLHPATVASMRLQSAILERRNPEFVDNYCEQGNALREPLLPVEDYRRLFSQGSLNFVLPELFPSAVGIICAQPSLDMYRTSDFRPKLSIVPPRF